VLTRFKTTNELLSRPTYIDFAHDTFYLTTPYYPSWDIYEELARLCQDSQKIESLAITVSSVKDDYLKLALLPLLLFSKQNKTNLRDIVVVVTPSVFTELAVWKHPENVGFAMLEAEPLSPWKAWEELDAHWTKVLQGRFTVRFLEVKVF